MTDFIERWPDQDGRKEVLMITDGIDRFRRQCSWLSALLPTLNPNFDSASDVCGLAIPCELAGK